VFARARDQTLQNGPPVVKSSEPMEQLNITRDLIDNMWYEVKFTLNQPITRTYLNLSASSANAFIVFIDGIYIGDVYNQREQWTTVTNVLSLPVSNLNAGPHVLSFLSSVLGVEKGMDTDEIPYDHHYKGISGRVTLGDTRITGTWTMRPYTVGEYLGIYTVDGSSNVEWSTTLITNAPLTWYQSSFTPPMAMNTSEVMIDVTGLGRGHIWINGRDIGRYWTILGGNSGVPTQRYYHVPYDWLYYDGSQTNMITILEEIGAADPNSISFVVVSMENINIDNNDNVHMTHTVSAV